MMDWNEDNFLERLMPYFRSGDTEADDPCPNPETLSAFVEGTLESGNRGAVQIHVARCSSCAQLCVRLKDFGAGNVNVGEAEWRNAEKRLDNWMEGFLRTGASGSTLTQDAQRGYSWWNPKTWLTMPTLGYALAASLSVALVIGITMFGRRQGTGRPQVTSVGHSGTAANSEPAQTGANRVPSATETEAAAMKPNPTTSIPPATTAHSVKPGNGPSENDIVRLKGEPMQGPLAATPAQTSGLDQVFSALSEIRIQAGTGMLLMMDSVTSQPDGRFVFQGHLSQPLVQDGRTVLPKSSLVVGSGMVSGRETSVWVSEIQSLDIATGTPSPGRNSRYALKAAGAQPNVRFSSTLLGGRPARGETLEARFVISSIYLHEATPSPRVWEVPNER